MPFCLPTPNLKGIPKQWKCSAGSHTWLGGYRSKHISAMGMMCFNMSECSEKQQKIPPAILFCCVLGGSSSMSIFVPGHDIIPQALTTELTPNELPLSLSCSLSLLLSLALSLSLVISLSLCLALSLAHTHTDTYTPTPTKTDRRTHTHTTNPWPFLITLPCWWGVWGCVCVGWGGELN